MKLKTKHLFKVLRIVKKGEMLDNLKVLLKDSSLETLDKELTVEQLALETERRQKQLGLDMAFAIIGGLELVEDEIYDLLAELKGVEKAEIAEQTFDATITDIKEIMSSEAVKGFLQQAVA